MKRTPLARTSRLNRVSAKTRRNRAAYEAVYREVEKRSRGRCEAFGMCPDRADDHHHTRKPRRAFHAPEWIVHLCRWHHDACERKYAAGRLLVVGMGDGTFTWEFVTAADKFAARALQGPR